MSEKVKQEFNKKKNKFEAKHNLVRFFNLLLEIDKRNNPENYKNNKKEIKC